MNPTHAILSTPAARSLALGAAGIALCACSSGSGTSTPPRAEAHQSSVATDNHANDLAELGYRLEWKGQPVIARGGSVEYLEIFDDCVGIHDDTNTMTIMEKATGRNRWSTKIWPDISRHLGTVQLSSGDLLASRMTEVETRDVKTGEIKSRHDLAFLANTRPIVLGNVAVYGTLTGELLGHNLVSGYKQWAYDMGAAINAAPVQVGDYAAAVAQNGRLLVVHPRRGRSVTTTEIFEGVKNEITASDRAVFIASTDQSLWAFGDLDREIIWRVRTSYPLIDSPKYHDGTVYCAVPHEGFSAFDAGSGEKRWTAPDVQGTAIARRKNNILVWNPPQLVAIDDRTGDVFLRVDLPGVSHIESDGFADGNLYISGPEGPVARYSTR